MLSIDNFGILTSISWSNNHWTKPTSEKDLNDSNYDFVKKHKHMHESLNFGHLIYPSEVDNTYIAYTPKFNRLPDKEKRKTVKIVFFASTDYSDLKIKKLVGCYGFPEIGKFKRLAEDNLFSIYDTGNVKSSVDNIIYFDQPIPITETNVVNLNLIPKDKGIAKQGFNYLNSENVTNLLTEILKVNSTDKRLITLCKKFSQSLNLSTNHWDKYTTQSITNPAINPNTIDGIRELELAMQNKTPKEKYRLSKSIERGSIAHKFKKLTEFKCMICQELGQPPLSFIKKNGEPYVEVHHVIPVSEKKKGSLGIKNLITVCPNHHRQLHYGDTEIIQNDNRKFIFRIDSNQITIQKITIR